MTINILQNHIGMGEFEHILRHALLKVVTFNLEINRTWFPFKLDFVYVPGYHTPTIKLEHIRYGGVGFLTYKFSGGQKVPKLIAIISKVKASIIASSIEFKIIKRNRNRNCYKINL